MNTILENHAKFGAPARTREIETIVFKTGYLVSYEKAKNLEIG